MKPAAISLLAAIANKRIANADLDEPIDFFVRSASKGVERAC